MTKRNIPNFQTSNTRKIDEATLYFNHSFLEVRVVTEKHYNLGHTGILITEQTDLLASVIEASRQTPIQILISLVISILI